MFPTADEQPDRSQTLSIFRSLATESSGGLAAPWRPHSDGARRQYRGGDAGQTGVVTACRDQALLIFRVIAARPETAQSQAAPTPPALEPSIGVPFQIQIEERRRGTEPPWRSNTRPVPVFAFGPGPVRCADAGTADASAAIIAAVLRSFFISLVLCCNTPMVQGG